MSRLPGPRTALRQITAAARPLPDFVVLGAQKAGTSSLFRYLAAHPSVVPALRKEVHYFDLHHGRGERWYRAHFPPLLSKGDRLVGEGTPYYLFHPRVPERLRALLPEAKLLVLLRDPVDRAFSHWQWERRHGRETLDFDDALAAEDARLAPELARWEAEPDAYAPVHHRWAYKARGRYAEQLERWLAVFPREQLYVERSERFFADTETVFREVVDFLGLPPWTPRRFRRFNTGGYDDRMSPETRAALRAHFAADQARLRELVGWDHSGA